jgi:hypothetical protein
VSNLPAWLAAGALACAAAGTVRAATQFVTLARSAQLTLDASPVHDGAVLRLRASTGSAAPDITGVSVSVAGLSEPARRQPDGTWFVPISPARGVPGGKLDVYVTHDGIREVLSGTLPAAPAAAAPASAAAGRGGGLLGAHKQLAWWVLNITIVLIGVLAVSRRMS